MFGRERWGMSRWTTGTGWSFVSWMELWVSKQIRQDALHVLRVTERRRQFHTLPFQGSDKSIAGPEREGQFLVDSSNSENTYFDRCNVAFACRVGIQLPTIEVRYESLNIDAKCFVGGRALPTLKNATLNFFEVAFTWHYWSRIPSQSLPCTSFLQGTAIILSMNLSVLRFCFDGGQILKLNRCTWFELSLKLILVF